MCAFGKLWHRQITSKTKPIGIKTLHAKIDELAMGNDFLEGVLIKADLLSAIKD